MRTDTTIELEGTEHVVEQDGDTWTLVLPRSLAPVRDPAELDLLAHDDDRLLPCRTTCTSDTVTLHLTPGDGLVPWSEVLAMSRAERLRALVNVGACAGLLERGYAVVLHPGNVLVDRNLRPRLVYRGLRGVMPPREADEPHLLRQYQALVLSTLDPRTPYATLVAGALTLRRSSRFEQAVVRAGSVADLAAYLTRCYDEAVADERDRLVRVSRRAHTAARHAAVWLGVVALAAGAVAGWATFVRAPFDARMLEADRRFVVMDYDGVIETLRPVPEEQLPLTQRYALAYSHLRGAGLSEEQRAAVENTLSMRAERDVLTYWVQVGRGELAKALDLAQGLNDVDLVLYALTLLQEQVAADPDLTGAEREARLAELEASYDTYLERRTAAVEEGRAADVDAPDGAAPDGAATDEPGDEGTAP